MSGAPQRLGALGLLLWGAMLGAPSCAQVLGVGDYENAADRACRCIEPQSSREACVELVTSRLEAATTEQVNEWVRAVSRDSCGCPGCVGQDPVCQQAAGACSFTEACCDGGSTICGRVDGVAGSVCREGCRRCSDLLLLAEGEDVPRETCFFSQLLVNDVSACLCNACSDACADTTVCGKDGALGAPCSACLKGAFADGGACQSRAQRCGEDRPVP